MSKDGLNIAMKTITVDSVINELGKSPTPLLGILWVWATLVGMVGCLSSYLGVFIGFTPTGEFTCLSTRCDNLLKNAQQQGQTEDFYKIDSICKSNLTHGDDFRWNGPRSSFSVDLNLFCSPSSLSLYHSIYKIGGLLAVSTGSILYERAGRRRAAAVGAAFISISTLCTTFARSYTVLLVLRVLQGLGDQLGYLGGWIWLFEMTPIRYRKFYNSWMASLWSLGYPVLSCIGYYIHNWRYICVAAGLVQVFCQIPLLIYPDSPRYLVSIGRSQQASSVLKRWARLAGADMNLEDVVLIEETVEDEGEARKEKMSVLQQLLEFKKYPAMLVETACICWATMVTAFLFNGLAFGWDRFGDSRYENYLYVGLGEVIGNFSVLLVLKIIGRKVALVSFYIGASTCFFLGIINYKFSTHWNVERVMSMFAQILTTASFCNIWLITGEVTATTHRGMVTSMANVFSAVCAFFGPIVSAADLTNVQRLSFFGSLAALAALSSLLFPETRGVEIPATAKDVRERRRKQRMIFKVRLPVSS